MFSRHLSLVRSLILFGALAGLSAALSTPASALKPVRGYPATPRDYGIICEEVAFQTSDSLRLVGWFYPAQDTTGIANGLVGRMVPVPKELQRPPRPYATRDRGRRPTIVICDGDAGNMADLIYYAYHFFPRGFNVFTFDWRGFGESAEWPTDPDQLCCTEFLADYRAALDYLKTRPEVDPARIGLLGFSTGAYLSFAMLVERKDVAAYAGRALMTSFEDLLPVLRRLDPKRSWHAPPDYPADCLPIAVAPHVHVPVFLIVGEKDPRTPPWMSEKILPLLKGPKELWIVKGAGHGGGSGPEFNNYPEFFERVAAFYGEHLGGR